MKALAGRLAFGLMLSVALPAGGAVASDPGEQLLLERANYWRSQHRPDLAGDILRKVLALNPSQPDALYQHGLIALEQGNRGNAEQYFDRLRLLAPSDSRAAELVGALAPAATLHASAPAAPTPAPIATAVVGSPAAPAARLLAVASADSDDLIPTPPPSPAGAPVRPRPRVTTAAALGEPPRTRQIASLPENTVSDGDMPIPATAAAARLAGSADLGTAAKTVQVAQVELQPPPPIGGYQRPVNVAPYSATDTLQTYIERDLTLLEQQSNPTLIAGTGFRWHDGTSGISELTEFGGSIEGSFSPWYTGTARITVLPVYLDAGTLSTSNLGQFGTNPILAAVGASQVGAGSQTAGGAGILGGYTYGDFSGQVGTSPLGFPVTNIVGLVAYSPKFFDNTLTVRLEGLRQPVTDSLLSYAGTRANVAAANAIVPGAFGTDGVWGGVVKTGGHITLFYDDQTYGAYGGAGLASLTGKNVAQNSQLDALLGAYFRPWKTDDWAIRVGVSVYYTSFNKNLDGFTFGQGGYFSPQNFAGLSFPVEYTGHSGPWSWLAGASLGVQRVNSDSSPIFPNNAAAQTALARLTTNTTFGGGNSTGPGFNVKGQIEYAVDNTLALGAAFNFDNGNVYNEVIGKLYLRKSFDWFAPVAVKSDPQSIVARDQPMSRL